MKKAKDYSKTVIYRIEVAGKNYYGHTTYPLHQRRKGHIGDCKKHPQRKLYKAMQDAGLCATDIELEWVEDYPCANVFEARERERYWVECDGSLNMSVPNRKHSEYMRFMRKNQEWNTLRNKKQSMWGRVQVSCDLCGKATRRDKISNHKRLHCKARPENLTAHKQNISPYTKEEDTMPPRRRNQPAQPVEQMTFTLNAAKAYLDGTNYAPNSVLNWWNNLTNLFSYTLEDEDMRYLPIKDLQENYGDKDILPLIKDYDKVEDIVENQVRSRRDGKEIALDTKKQIYYAVYAVLGKESPIRDNVGKEIRDKYDAKVKEYDKLSNLNRNKNVAQRGNAAHPDLTWDVIKDEFKDFKTTANVSATGSGKKNLKSMVCAGLYVLHTPRRLEDYAYLQMYSKLPNAKEMEGKNILLVERGGMEFHIDRFKTRFKANKDGSKKKELLPRFVKKVDKSLESLLRDYITKFKIKDMTKRTAEEKRAGKQYFVFNKEPENEEGYNADSFGGYMSKTAFPTVFKKRKGLSVNSFRHAWATDLAKNFNQYNAAQHKEFAIEQGDTPRELPTNIRYMIQEAENIGLAKSEIKEGLDDNEYARKLAEGEAEGAGSVMNEAPPRVADLVAMDRIDEEGEVSGGGAGEMTVADITRRLGEIEVEKARLLKILLR
jgi:hypothetical protein